MIIQLYSQQGSKTITLLTFDTFRRSSMAVQLTCFPLSESVTLILRVLCCCSPSTENVQVRLEGSSTGQRCTWDVHVNSISSPTNGYLLNAMVGVFGLSENSFVGKTMSSHTQYMHIVIFYITFICVRHTQYKYIVTF